jgi:hypothetical protein
MEGVAVVERQTAAEMAGVPAVERQTAVEVTGIVVVSVPTWTTQAPAPLINQAMDRLP